MKIFKHTAKLKEFHNKPLPVYYLDSRFYYICFITSLSVHPSLSFSCFSVIRRHQPTST